MGPLMEIIFFALISTYLFYRLWSILGQETDEDLERRNRNSSPFSPGEKEHVASSRTDNTASPPVEEPSFLEETFMKHGVRESLKTLRKMEPNFDLDRFITGARRAYDIIITAYSQGDLETLKSLLDEKVYTSFAQAIKEQREAGTIVKTTIDKLEKLEIDRISIQEENVRITVRYRSRQTIITHKENGEIIDNPAEISIPITDIWTYTRSLRSQESRWYLVATASESYRD